MRRRASHPRASVGVGVALERLEHEKELFGEHGSLRSVSGGEIHADHRAAQREQQSEAAKHGDRLERSCVIGEGKCP